MPFFPFLKDDAGIAQIYTSQSKTYLPWIQMGEKVMWEDGPLTRGERELLATYVSCLSDCDYCREAHVPSMALHGIERAGAGWPGPSGTRLGVFVKSPY
jgi:AhpD family alkylhydroperoxidase